MNMDIVRWIIVGVTLVFINGKTLADEHCFNLAENYYEQIYCELKAKGKGRVLPSFNDFRKNKQLTQALLLRPIAKKAGIAIAMPIRKTTPSAHLVAKQNLRQLPKKVAAALTGCNVTGDTITCGPTTYEITGNRVNSQLIKGALLPGNRMSMPSPSVPTTPARVRPYLQTAYQVYLEKMLEIGLGGVTMHFNKFSYFFYDITEKGVSFNGRFETMFQYLKKDKQRLGISKTALPDELNLSSCQKVSDAIITCAMGNKNYLFVKSL